MTNAFVREKIEREDIKIKIWIKGTVNKVTRISKMQLNKTCSFQDFPRGLLLLSYLQVINISYPNMPRRKIVKFPWFQEELYS